MVGENFSLIRAINNLVIAINQHKKVLEEVKEELAHYNDDQEEAT